MGSQCSATNHLPIKSGCLPRPMAPRPRLGRLGQIVVPQCSENHGKQLLTLSPEARHEGRNRLKLAGFARRVQDVSERITNKFDPDPVAQFRWVPWVLALLVILCLLLAAWVWFEILHT